MDCVSWERLYAYFVLKMSPPKTITRQVLLLIPLYNLKRPLSPNRELHESSQTIYEADGAVALIQFLDLWQRDLEPELSTMAVALVGFEGRWVVELGLRRHLATVPLFRLSLDVWVSEVVLIYLVFMFCHDVVNCDSDEVRSCARRLIERRQGEKKKKRKPSLMYLLPRIKHQLILKVRCTLNSGCLLLCC